MPGARTTTDSSDATGRATDAQGSRGQRGTVTNRGGAHGVGRTRGIVVLRPADNPGPPERETIAPANRAPGVDINMLRALAAALEETKNSAPTPPWSVSLTTSHMSEKVTPQLGVSVTLYHPWEVNKYQANWGGNANGYITIGASGLTPGAVYTVACPLRTAAPTSDSFTVLIKIDKQQTSMISDGAIFKGVMAFVASSPYASITVHPQLKQQWQWGQCVIGTAK